MIDDLSDAEKVMVAYDSASRSFTAAGGQREAQIIVKLAAQTPCDFLVEI
jgi:hypothetical protein